MIIREGVRLMKTMLSALSTLLCGAVFIIIFVFVGSFVAEFSSKYFESVYKYAILLLDFTFFGLIMLAMLYTMSFFEKLIG